MDFGDCGGAVSLADDPINFERSDLVRERHIYRGGVVKYNRSYIENKIDRTEFSTAIDDPSIRRPLPTNWIT